MRYYNDVAILSPAGRLDSFTAAQFAETMAGQLEAGYARQVIDLKKIDFLNSSGIKALLAGAQEARRQGGDVRIANAQPRVKQVLALAGMDDVVKLYPNVVGATASYFPGP